MLWLFHTVLIKSQQKAGNEKLFYRHLAMLILTLIAVIANVLALPVADSTRNQILGLLGLIISGVIAFSSSTIFANLMAGFMLRVTRPFATGDFVRVGDVFGRVVERGLLDTELQTDKRELVALPNTYLISRPVSVVRSSGALVSCDVSIGYDEHHSRIESLLLEATEQAGLTDGFVQVIELADHVVCYRVNGILSEVKNLISARSQLFRCVLDRLHENDVEIMSPRFMGQRPIPDGVRMVPAVSAAAQIKEEKQAEEVIFDKAESAQQKEQSLQQLQSQRESLLEKIKNADAEQKTRLKHKLETLEAKIVEIKAAGNGENP